MRRLSTLILAVLSTSLHADPAKLDTERDRMSYGLGHDIGLSFKRQGMAIDAEAVKLGMQDAMSGAPARMGAEDMKKAVMELRRLGQATLREQAEKAAETKRAAGRAFLDANAKKEGVAVTASGLQYRVIKAGEGKKPGPQDKVTVHYRGTLINGEEFDSSYRRGQPATFALNAVIAGWTEGLQLMNEGALYEFSIPPELAYGKRGQLADETLVFQVELLAVATAAN